LLSQFPGFCIFDGAGSLWVIISEVSYNLYIIIFNEILHMTNQKTAFVIIALVAALSVAIAPTMMNTAVADDPFDGKGNPHDEPGAKDGDPHIDKKTGNPHHV
jgi:hypothetical protein